jgi:acyl-CoA thioesterase II
LFMNSNLFSLDRIDDGPCFQWTPSPILLTPAGTLQGGAGLGAAITAMQTVSERPVIWATAQYLAFALGNAPVDLEVTIEVSGHNTTQARCVVSRDGKEILTAHGALGSRDFDVEDVWCAPPIVPAPEDCPEYRFVANRVPNQTQVDEGSDGRFVEFRLAKGRQMDDIAEQGGRGTGSFAVWVKRIDGAMIENIGDLTYIGDFLPIGFAEAMGQPYVGNSLDNTVRVGKLVPTPWVLLSINIQQVSRGFGYGRAELWAQDGTLLAETSQSAILRLHAKVHESRAGRKHV